MLIASLNPESEPKLEEGGRALGECGRTLGGRSARGRTWPPIRLTKDDGGEGAPVEVVDPPRLSGSSQEGVVDGERGTGRWDGEDDYL